MSQTEAAVAATSLHDEATWRLPNWEEYSESGCSSAWTDADADVQAEADVSGCGSGSDRGHESEGETQANGYHATTDGDTDSDADKMRSQWRAWRSPMARASPSTVTTPKNARVSMAMDLRALHARFAEQRQRYASTSATALATEAPHGPVATTVGGDLESRRRDTVDTAVVTTAIASQQAVISTQLASVREQLRAFERKWQASVESAMMQRGSISTAAQESTVQTTTSSTSPPQKVCGSTASSAQTDHMPDENKEEEAVIRQWLHLITQKVDVLASSFHHETTQLPIRYSEEVLFQKSTEASSRTGSVPATGTRSIPFSASPIPVQMDSKPLSSWHVGADLKSKVSEPSAQVLLDLERAVACLATATSQTTQRYVSYFEKIVEQIQDVHQQRLRQVVEESLQEMKTQRQRHKRKVEQLEDDTRAVKQEMEAWRDKATTANQASSMDKETLAMVVSSSKEQLVQFDQANKRAQDEITRLTKLLHSANAACDKQEDRIAELQMQWEQAKTEADHTRMQLRRANDNVKRLNDASEDTVSKIEQLQLVNEDLRASLRQQQQKFKAHSVQMEKTHTEEMEALGRSVRREVETEVMERVVHERLEALRQEHARELAEKEKNWHKRQQQEAKSPPVTNRNTQTESALNIDTNDADERIARLTRRCRALESLLDKKFETTSVASSPTRSQSRLDTSYLSTRSVESAEFEKMRRSDVGTTMPLTDSSLDTTTFYPHQGDSMDLDEYSNHSYGSKTNRSLEGKASVQQREMWDTATLPSSSMGSPYLHTPLTPLSAARSSRSTAYSTASRSFSPAAPSPEDMLALVHKLESIASPSLRRHSLKTQPDSEPEGSDMRPWNASTATGTNKRDQNVSRRRPSTRASGLPPTSKAVPARSFKSAAAMPSPQTTRYHRGPNATSMRQSRPSFR